MHSKLIASFVLLTALGLGACAGSSSQPTGIDGVRVEPADGVTFVVGANAPRVQALAYELAEFVYQDLVYQVAVTFHSVNSDLSPCTVDGTRSRQGFGVEIMDVTGTPYGGPVALTAKAILPEAFAFLAVAGVCTQRVEYEHWVPGSASGTVSFGAELPEDTPGAGSIGLELVVEIPGTRGITIIPGEGTRSERVDTLTPEGQDPPTLGDHWHAAYGVYVCDQYRGPFEDVPSDQLGIRTHGDGLIHIHPFSSRATGANANLGLFAEQIGLELEDGRLTLPNGERFQDGDRCGPSRGRLRVLLWDSPTASEPREVVRALARIRLKNDLVLAIVFAPDQAQVEMPRWVANLSEPLRAEQGQEPLVR